MNGQTYVRDPAHCADEERREFASVVRQGFNAVIETLPRRITAAKYLAFHRLPSGPMVAVAAIKSPPLPYREDVFLRAGIPRDPSIYDRELGWIYVMPEHRGFQIGRRLCERLVERSTTSRMFATTRVENARMIGILESLEFGRVGEPYQRRNEVLALYCRDGAPPP